MEAVKGFMTAQGEFYTSSEKAAYFETKQFVEEAIKTSIFLPKGIDPEDVIKFLEQNQHLICSFTNVYNAYHNYERIIIENEIVIEDENEPSNNETKP
jgi:hypothetical protein